jgi:hypothetical protein
MLQQFLLGNRFCAALILLIADTIFALRSVEINYKWQKYTNNFSQKRNTNEARMSYAPKWEQEEQKRREKGFCA